MSPERQPDYSALLMKIKVGPIDWEVHYSSGSEDFGSTDYLAGVIYLNPNQGKALFADTLFHELIHATVAQFGIRFESPEQEEAIIRTLAPALLDVLCSNPHLTDYLFNPSQP